MRFAACIGLAACIGASCALTGAAHAATLLEFRSDPGDYIGGGQNRTWDERDGTFIAGRTYGRKNVVSISFNGDDWWSLDFEAPKGEMLRVGPYEDATRFPFNSPTGNGLSISGNGAGCNTLTGRFDVLQIEVSPSGDIERFAADFEQHCERGTPALRGSVRYNATVGFPPKVAITANGRHTGVTVAPGEPVAFQVTLEAGDDKGLPAEKWLGVLRPYYHTWFDGRQWTHRIAPLKWGPEPLADLTRRFSRTFDNPGVYTFLFAADPTVDGKFDTPYVDSVVVTVQSPPAVR